MESLQSFQETSGILIVFKTTCRQAEGRNLRTLGIFSVLATVAVLFCSPAIAQSRSGYGSTQGLESGDSVTEDIHQDDIDAGSAFRFPNEPLKPWFDAKRRWNDKYGLKLNFSYQTLAMRSNNTTGADEAAAGRGEINGSWTLVGRGTQNAGRLTFRIENRTKFGTPVVPQTLGNEFGSGTIVGTGFSDFGFNISELAWRQSAMSGRLMFVFGKISAAGWYGGHLLSSPKRAFQNTAFLGSNTRAFPGRGFGGGVGYRISNNYLVSAGVHDANAKTSQSPFDTIGQEEFLYNVEFRWLPNGMDNARWDQVRLHFWHQDEKKSKGTPAGSGVNLVASHRINDRYLPFFIAGLSDGNASTFERDFAVGLGIGFDTTAAKARDTLGIGLAWGEPSNSAFQDQITGELFYRFQLLDNFAITPSIQWINNPTFNPSETNVTVVGLRMRVTF